MNAHRVGVALVGALLAVGLLTATGTPAGAHNNGVTDGWVGELDYLVGPLGGSCWIFGQHFESVYSYPVGSTSPPGPGVGAGCQAKDGKVEAWVWGSSFTSTTWGAQCTGASCVSYAVNPNQGWFSIQSWHKGCWASSGAYSSWCTPYVALH